jgi:hypothetical protein
MTAFTETRFIPMSSDSIHVPLWQGGSIAVDIQDPDTEGSREFHVPSIELSVNGGIAAMLTWTEAQRLAHALLGITLLARSG